MIRLILRLLAPAFLLSGALPVGAASFDCAKATTAVEKAICAQPDLSRQDEALAQAYQQLLSRVGKPWDERVKQSQREWLKTRNDDASSAAPGKAMNEALKTAFSNRLQALNAAVSTHNGLKFLTVNRVMLQKLDKSGLPDDSPYAQQRYVRQERAPVFLMSDVPGGAVFNALLDKEFALPKEPPGGASEETSSGATVTFASPELISVAIASYYFGIGAAHPIGAAGQLNFMLGESRPMLARDLFASSAYANVIVRHVAQAFKKAELEALSTPAEVRQYVLDPQHWSLSPKGLEVVVAPDSLFPHAVGSPEVPVLPWSAFKGQLTSWAEKVFAKP